MRERVRQVMAGVFGVAADEIPDDPNPENFPQWDSLRQIELMLALEMEFGVTISTDAMLDLLSLEAIEDHLRQHGNGRV